MNEYFLSKRLQRTIEDVLLLMVMGRETTGDLEVANKFHKAAVTLLFDQMETKP